MSLPEPIPAEDQRAIGEQLDDADNGPADLPFAPVKRIAKLACASNRDESRKPRFNDDAILLLAQHAERAIRELAVPAFNAARVAGRKTVQPEDVQAALAALQPAKRGKRAPGSHAEQKLAIANRRLVKAGLPPELLGRFEGASE